MGTPDEARYRLGELNELAAHLCADGRYEAAAPLFERVVAACTASLGADDPDTLISHGNLVMTQLRLDPRGSALSGLDANVAARSRVLGIRHPATRRACDARLAAYDRAVAGLERMLAERAATVGPDHPDTAALRAELAELRARAAQPVTDPLPAVPASRRPRGARFPRSLPDQRAAEPASELVAPAGARRPRGARFPRKT
jgi:Tetratricopeptide repeat